MPASRGGPSRDPIAANPARAGALPPEAGAMSDERPDPADLPGSATQMAHDWPFLMGSDAPEIAVPVALIPSGVPFEQASDGLEEVSLERLTVDSEDRAPFSDLGYNLLSTILDRV